MTTIVSNIPTVNVLYFFFDSHETVILQLICEIIFLAVDESQIVSICTRLKLMTHKRRIFNKETYLKKRETN